MALLKDQHGLVVGHTLGNTVMNNHGLAVGRLQGNALLDGAGLATGYMRYGNVYDNHGLIKNEPLDFAKPLMPLPKKGLFSL